MKKARGAIAFVVVCHRSATSFLHWQTRLHTIQSLDLRFFIHTQHHSLVRRVQIDAYNVGQLFHKPLVLGQLEGLHAVRLQAVGIPNPMHGSMANTLDLSHRPCRPVRCVLRRGMQSYFHNFKDFLDIESPRTGTMEESAFCRPDRRIRSITVRSDLPEDVIGISSTTTMRLGTA